MFNQPDPAPRAPQLTETPKHQYIAALPLLSGTQYTLRTQPKPKKTSCIWKSFQVPYNYLFTAYPGAQAIPTLGQDTIVNYISRLYVNDQYRVTIWTAFML